MLDDPWAEFSKKPTPTNTQDDPWASLSVKPTQQQPQQQQKRSVAETIGKDLAYGVENDILRGPARTLQQEGYPNVAAAANTAADYVHRVAGLDGFDPTGGDPSLKGRIKNIPNALIQGAPGMAQDVAAGGVGAAVGGPVGGMLGFGGSYLLRHLGETRDRIREASGKGPNDPLTTGEQLRAAGTLFADTMLNRIGIGKALNPGVVKNVGLRAIPEIADKVVQSTGTGALIGAGQNAIDTVALDQKAPSLSDTVVAGVTGAGAGLAGSTPMVAKEGMRAARFAPLGKLDQDSVTSIANIAAKAREQGSQDLPTSVVNHLNTQIDNAMTLGGFGRDKSVKTNLKSIKTSLGNGEEIDPQHLGAIESAVGHTAEGQELVRAIRDRNTLNQMSPLFNGGIGATALGRLLNPFARPESSDSALQNAAGYVGRRADIAALFHSALTNSPGVAEAVIGTQLAGMGGISALDRLSGASNPLKVVIDKYAGGANRPAPVEPSVGQLAQNQLALKKYQDRTLGQLASLDREDAAAKKAKVENYQKRTLGALSDLDKQDAKVAADKQKANAKTVSDFQKTAGKMLGGVSFMPESERFNSELYSDPVNPTLLKMAQKWPGSRDLGQRDFSGSLEEVAARYGDNKLLNELQASTAGQAENAKLEQLLAQERAMRAQGINQNSMPLPPSARSAQIAAAVERQLRERTANAAPPEMPPTTSGSPFDAKLAALAARRANPPPPAPAPAPESPMMASRKRLQEQLDAQASRPLPDRAGLFPELPEPVRTPPATPSAPEAASKTPRKTTTSTKAKPDRGALFPEPVVPERATAPSPVAEALQEAKPKKTKAAPKTPVQQAMDESPLMAKRRELERKLEDGQDTNSPPQKGPRKFVEDRPKYSTLKEAQAARPDLSKQGWYKVVFDKDRSVWQHEDDVTHNKQSRISATEQNNSSRDNVFNHGLTIKLSPKGREIYDRMMPQWRKTFSSNAIKYRETAEQRLQEEVFARFKGKDLETVKQLFSEGVPRKNSRGQTRKGKAFLNHWRHANEEDHLDHLTDLHFKE